jgi:protein gp37
MIDIAKGRYWDLPWSLVDGCTPCSPGCDHCWSAGMTHRFEGDKEDALTCSDGAFNGEIITHPERLSIPLRRRKPTVYAVWNDFWHEYVVDDFQYRAFQIMQQSEQHTFLILTKRPQIAAAFFREGKQGEELAFDNIYFGLTVCNQQEADKKIPVFLQVPGKKFLNIEPMLEEIHISKWLHPRQVPNKDGYGGDQAPGWTTDFRTIDAVILGGETGPGARPMHPDWVRSVRDSARRQGFRSFSRGGVSGFLYHKPIIASVKAVQIAHS